MITKISIFKKIFEKGVTFDKKTGTYDFDFDKDRKNDIMNLQPMYKRSKMLERDGVKYHYYFAYEYKHGTHDGFLKAIKYIDNGITNQQAQELTANAVTNLLEQHDIRNQNFSAIIYPQSSSKILTRFVNELMEQALIDNVIDNAFVKNSVKNIELDLPAVKKLPPQTQKQVYSVFNKIKNMKTEFKLKDVYTRYRKFIKNFIKLDKGISRKVTGKKIILMDDYHTTGATLKEMTNILIEHQPTEIFIIVLIKVK